MLRAYMALYFYPMYAHYIITHSDAARDIIQKYLFHFLPYDPLFHDCSCKSVSAHVKSVNGHALCVKSMNIPTLVR